MSSNIKTPPGPPQSRVDKIFENVWLWGFAALCLLDAVGVAYAFYLWETVRYGR